MIVTWALPSPAEDALEVLIAGEWTRFPAWSVKQYSTASYMSPFIHHATVRGLLANTSYEYRISSSSSSSSSSSELSSYVMRTPDDSYPLTVAVLGDHGQTPYSEETIEALGMHQPRPQVTFLVGDLSYADGQGERWDSWESIVEPTFSEMPLLALPGNHEIENAVGEAFEGYRRRYPAPEVASEIVGPGTFAEDTYDNNLTYDYGSSFYSFSVGRAKFLALNTYAEAGEGSRQRAWLERELSCVDRSVTPWVIVGMHAPWYSTNEKHRPELATSRHRNSLEPVLSAAGVSLVLSGHVHAYERSHAVCLDRVGEGPTYVTIGDGGNREALYDAWPYHNDEPWSAFRNGTKYGFGTIEFYNDSVAAWRWLPNEVRGPRDEIFVENRLEPCDEDASLPEIDDCEMDVVAAVEARRSGAREDDDDDDDFVVKKGNIVLAKQVVLAVIIVLALAVSVTAFATLRAAYFDTSDHQHAFLFGATRAAFHVGALELDTFVPDHHRQQEEDPHSPSDHHENKDDATAVLV
ncbi:hypothetical protein CTAYLR_004861 [Chrysophaeum taylorii]|uniref:Purple acid phosphatase n=1 Tax=Chrysophaeum taylorii TaxID=2483200 RepID=A0AAD7UFR7_9STRA|nr:hypothetical protein CTAYLR_004861 [Chrysophaeum taylorii]